MRSPAAWSDGVDSLRVEHKCIKNRRAPDTLAIAILQRRALKSSLQHDMVSRLHYGGEGAGARGRIDYRVAHVTVLLKKGQNQLVRSQLSFGHTSWVA